MKIKISIRIFFLLMLVINAAAAVGAQEEPQAATDDRATLFSPDDKNAPFRDGETKIAEIEFLGLDPENLEYYDTTNGFALLESDFRMALNPNRFVPYFKDWKYDRAKVKKLIEIFRQHAARYGYQEAKVTALAESLPGDQVRLIYEIERGNAARVSEIRFVGNRHVSGEELLAAFQARADYWRIFRPQYYKIYLENSARQLMLGKGFLQAKIKSIAPEKTSNGYVVTIEVEEGVRYRIGGIKIAGTAAFGETEILEMLGQSAGDAADGRALRIFFDEKLKRIYAEKGYLLYSAALDFDFIKPRAGGADGTVNIRATVKEGKIYRISKIDFWEIDEAKAKQLLRLTGLKVGDIYNESALETAIKNIDATGEFEPINPGFAVNLRANEETGELEIEFLLSKKE